MPEAIFFDLDNTIINYVAPDDIWRTVCYRYAPDISGLEPGRLFEAVRRFRDWFWADEERHRRGRNNLVEARREIVSLAFQSLEIDSTEISDRIADAYSVEHEATVTMVPGAVDTLERFKKRGIRLALVTNGAADMQRTKIERFRLEPFFDFIMVEGEFGIGKPDIRVFNRVLSSLGVQAADVWMVGDDIKRDIAPCLSLGIYAIWVDKRGTGLTSDSVVPDRIIKNISELDGAA